MHRYVLSLGFLAVSVTTVACSSGTTQPAAASNENTALAAGKGGDPGKGGGGGGTGGSSGGSCGDPGKCFSETLAGCWDVSKAKDEAAAKCGGTGFTLTAFELGKPCGANSASDITFTCCESANQPPPPPVCKDLPIPADICKDPQALKDYAVKICGDLSPGLSFPDGDPCSPKSSVECCEPSPPTPPPPVCKDLPIPADVCKDPALLKDYAVKICGDASANIIVPDGDPCGPKSVVECCDSAKQPPPPPPPKK